ncbi:Prolipoprotein diacylglyceryl transferase,prolipoprotein diacylglyceryl transferase,prolipoprotein diacylglyceryl transferase,Prolipoprotein diacylglyceryl transferase [Chlamydia poikilotherma]|uniref:Phosphatidylglycerol--prolipoprotein diacylglyceryl transferase n=1 Tax=Chlamydia poikilotherma TaxID=1967783 RepID=A0A3B0QGA3_9CHLA|nr:prolipoprotein diacylglyceryl transferase [Chlamydia poikilotherma]SYX08954.1 Prolipoprotein diacylglyceryl transferase,prolipoprotein diacylglyceryl transferase,prolipoprotein diacylglyceryl transferase,Prolipoprotein diacylglyceryl transferase [Chlamydia poikilotherma]
MRVFLSVIYWSHSKFLWNSDNLPIRVPWYGLCFSLGILLASILGIYLALSSYHMEDKKRFSKNQLREALENFALYSLLFIIPGSRIAYILFYGGDFYFKHPQEILKVWNGGLASHGGMVGLILWAIIFSWRYRKKIPVLTFLFLSDLCASVFGCAAFMIRIGNFMNQEIIGKPTNLPWGIIFSSPTQGSLGVSVHPVQLYEGIGYLLLSIILFFLSYKRYFRLGSGWATSLGLIGISLIRFFAEFFKSHQGKVIGPNSLLTMGQILSLPLFIFGVSLGVACFIKNKKGTSSTSSIK